MVEGGEGLEPPSLAVDLRPWYFREGGRVTLPFPNFWPQPVRGGGSPTLPLGPAAVRDSARVPHPPTSPNSTYNHIDELRLRFLVVR